MPKVIPYTLIWMSYDYQNESSKLLPCIFNFFHLYISIQVWVPPIPGARGFAHPELNEVTARFLAL